MLLDEVKEISPLLDAKLYLLLQHVYLAVIDWSLSLLDNLAIYNFRSFIFLVINNLCKLLHFPMQAIDLLLVVRGTGLLLLGPIMHPLQLLLNQSDLS